MTALKYTSAIVFLSVLQLSVLPPLLGTWPTPNLLFIFIMALAILGSGAILFGAELKDDLVFGLGLAGGFILDIFSTARFGVFILIFTGTILLIKLIFKSWFAEGFNYQNLVMLFIFSVFLAPLAAELAGHNPLGPVYFLRSLILSVPAVVLILRFIYVRTG
ncbi:MAG: hypothetical protein A3J48_00395 [Candidatus Doudnabacteria bacterium RIFCSPHIGHO2_02_FULL_46_11]|uniref:Rod shape-determining protein MreD n=1 Tax=Candidatus Doudnabacteria bacterium RIFCSPHIGHO2_02_FULL_46_11 TaxID=1817832 RepID=A0A1F5P4Z6_9BACT|nr:MAG: hypothetical protein A3J48_00395 [Candidatus Doudnabacteria bacterium RIFCSPHIGHO2_02_FULL_46_11]